MSAIISSCGTYRYRLEREVQATGPIYAYFGVNCSTADATVNDQTVKKWLGFTRLNGGSRFIVGNVFAYRSPLVEDLDYAADPVGPENDRHLAQIIADADILVPCWGSRRKLPSRLRDRLDVVSELLFDAGKPVEIWGLSKSRDPLHPLTLSYELPLVKWLR